jgi:hypothetical protein
MTLAENPNPLPPAEAAWTTEVIYGNFEEFLAKPEAQLVGNKFAEFKAHVDTQYSEEDARLITSSAILATVLHQHNEVESARYRSGERDRLKIPYIEHPLGAGSILAGMPSEIDINDTDGNNLTIPVKQKPHESTNSGGGTSS